MVRVCHLQFSLLELISLQCIYQRLSRCWDSLFLGNALDLRPLTHTHLFFEKLFQRCFCRVRCESWIYSFILESALATLAHSSCFVCHVFIPSHRCPVVAFSQAIW